MTASPINFAGRGRLPIIHQTEAAECGLACLAMIASYHGNRIDLNTLRRRHPVSLQGVTLRALIEVAAHLKLASRAVRFELGQLRQLHLPVILHWDMSHFVVLKSVTTRGIVVHDPAFGKRVFSINEASKHLTGVALELSPSEGFHIKDERARLPLSIFWTQLRGNRHALVQIVILSIILEAFVIASPFYLQLTVDEVIARGDADFLVILALGFGLLTAFKVAANAIRSFIIMIVQNMLHYQIGARLFHHLVRLPIVYFEKRHIGDVLSRFTSIEPIRRALVEGMIAATIDGVMATATLAMIFVYSTQLALVVLTAFVLYAILRLGLYPIFRERSQAVIEARAQENSTLIETLRAIQSLKLFNREYEREGLWLNRYSQVVNANVSLGRVTISFATIKDIIFGLEAVVTIYLAARLALSNSLTIGMIFAFMSYKLQFTEKAALLVEKALDFRILELHLERLADVALTPLERGHDQALSYKRQIQGRIELRHVSFRYAETEPFVIQDINLVVAAGAAVTIMGPSGGGKTTLIKIMVGLLEPTCGEVLIDGIPVSTLGNKAYREQIGVVMQEDQLLSGSVADNICFFDTAFDSERMIRCAQRGGIHDEIMAMPMTYNTLIGDMGSSLSGGQKQRVLLARALYRQPRMLFLDEGTAHLDSGNERRIEEVLSQLHITRISVAHRPNRADRIVWIDRTLNEMHGQGAMTVSDHPLKHLWLAPLPRHKVMKHPVRSDFHTVVTEAGVSVTFKPTNSVYSFRRLADANDTPRLGLISFAGVQHEGRDTEDYACDEVQDMAQQIASEHARSIWSVQDEALAGIHSEPTDDIARLRPVSLAGIPRRIASEVVATLRLIQNLDKENCRSDRRAYPAGTPAAL